MMSSFLTVIVCSHNPRLDYLARTIDGLASQTLDRSHWEFILVDNHSATQLAASVDLGWHPGGRIIREDKLGLTPARLRGIREAKSELLIFVDDDNILDSDFLETALRISEERPYLGSWSGQCRPLFDEQPPEWTRRYWGNLVLREFNEDRWSNLPRLADTMPCGAGLCVRREVALHYLQLNESGQRGFQFDRTGNSLVSGGDNDLAACACDLGMGVGIMAGLKLQHMIPPERLTVDYLARLAEGIHFSSALLDHERGLSVLPRTKSRRVLDFIRMLCTRSPHRQVVAAAVHGHDKALEAINHAR